MQPCVRFFLYHTRNWKSGGWRTLRRLLHAANFTRACARHTGVPASHARHWRVPHPLRFLQGCGFSLRFSDLREGLRQRGMPRRAPLRASYPKQNPIPVTGTVILCYELRWRESCQEGGSQHGRRGSRTVQPPASSPPFPQFLIGTKRKQNSHVSYRKQRASLRSNGYKFALIFLPLSGRRTASVEV